MRKFRRITLIGLCSALAILAGGAASAEPAGGSVVRTADGPVRGTVADGHRVFYGIPYAAPPTGNLRWRAPQPAKSWQGVRDATVQGSFCPQTGYGGPPVMGNEDCLFVNVTTPERPARRLPVMVFVHGGGFFGGTGSPFNAERVAEQGDVVVVTLNYRLGALGFLSHPALSDPHAGNFGIADQQAALRWVQRNAAAFGGDPGNVSLWGESAGAFSVCSQLASPGARGLFHKAIIHSGPCANSFITAPVARQRGRVIAEDLGCTGNNVVECLRAKPVEDLVGLNEDQAYRVNRYTAGLPWQPVVGTPVLPVQPLTALRTGTAARVPLIHGGTKDEQRSFVASAYDGAGEPLTAEQYPEAVRALYGKETAKVLAEYPVADYLSPGIALATLVGDEGRMLGTCNQLPVDEAASRWAPVYAYEFAQPTIDTIGDFPLGAKHGADIPSFFDSKWPDRPPSVPPAGEKKVFADKLISYWTTFAKTGNPGGGWAPYREGNALSFSIAEIKEIDVSAAHKCGFWNR
ncbi:carboxylesterase/lipase family protein [Amycolatopsis sp. lyj-112]|uniref:carboxylesterase/lipase family protein n=1 Tax=Amycolatopsis sp. lyj-112 TaxID=2789288 RepID=UPI00397D2CA7